MGKKTPITVAHGDSIGPEIMEASLHIIQAAGQGEAAGRVHNAWLRTIEKGIHTYDIYEEGVSRQKVGTKEFAKAVAANVKTESLRTFDGKAGFTLTQGQ